MTKIDPSDERFQDNVEFRFFVGGVACKGLETYEKLVATSAMCAAYKTALQSNASEHGAAPWVTVVTESEGRRDGLVKGPSSAVVGASRDATYRAAAEAAILVFEHGSAGLSTETCQRLLKLCMDAGARCPLDVQKIRTTVAARVVEDSAAKARELGAEAEDVAALAESVANVQVWQPHVDVSHDVHLTPETMTDVMALIDAVKMHHGPAFDAAAVKADRDVKGVMGL